MLLVLIGFILRPVAHRLSRQDRRPALARRLGLDLLRLGRLPSLLFGVAFGNVLLGVPFHFDDALRFTYEGGLLGLLRPFALLCGAISVSMLADAGRRLARRQERRRGRRAGGADRRARGARRWSRCSWRPVCGSRSASTAIASIPSSIRPGPPILSASR